jgi:diguanylate cyclase (GGDEF)-like protein
LRNFSRIIAENVRGTDGAFRYGGEEFIIIYSGTVGKEAYRAAKHLNSYMSDAIMEFTDEKGETYEKTVTFSGGVTQITKDDSLKDAVERADRLLYQAKESGRNQIKFKE